MNEDPGKRPELAWLPIDRLTVDARYQRDTASRRSRNIVAKIAADFRWPRFGAVLAVKSGDEWAVIDGQHRVEACRARGDIGHVPAIVLPHSTIEAAAADFVAINRDRVAVTPLHIHHAMVAAGEAHALKIQAVCAEAGVTICRYPVPENKMKPGETLAIGAIARAITVHGEKAAIALRALARGTDGKPGSLRASLIRASVAAIVGGAREESVCAVFSSHDHQDLMSFASEARGEGGFQAAMNAVVGHIAAGRVPPKAPAPAKKPPLPATGQPIVTNALRAAIEYLRDHGVDVRRTANNSHGWQIGDVIGYSAEEVIDFSVRWRDGPVRGARA